MKMTREQVLAKLNEKLKELRYGWSDDIPDSIVRSTDSDNRLKCRNAWWQGVLNKIDDAANYGLISPEQHRDYLQSYDSIQRRRAYDGEELREKWVTTPREIADANELLDTLMRSIGSEVPETVGASS